jgi:16S rRNA (cytosine967-C5)-methyltransferase
MSPARQLAFEILARVEKGAWASDLLHAAPAEMDSRDAGLASEIVFGVLRHLKQLDFLIDYYSGRRARLDAPVRIALRMGIYQLRYLDRVPAHAAVGESVELVKRARVRSAGGLVNAVLRKVTRDPVPWPDRATELCLPGWLLARWDRNFRPDRAEKIARAFLCPPDQSMAGGRFMDVNSQAIVPQLGLTDGVTLLDLCAAPGNKTLQAVTLGADVIACDLHFSRLREVQVAKRVVLDATGALPFREKFDRVLVDVPCSGTGTLGRNPEIKWRLKPEDLDDLHRRQVRILRNAMEVLAPRGRLLYSTCSLEPEENEQVIREALPIEREVHMRWITPGLEPGDGFFSALIPGSR